MHAEHGDRRSGGPFPLAFVLPAAISLLIQVPPTVVIGLAVQSPPLLLAPKILAAALGALALLGSWRRPGAALIVIAGLTLVFQFLPPMYGPPPVALGFALVIALVRTAPAWALLTACATWVVGVGLAEVITPEVALRRIIAGTIALALCLGIGMAVRGRRERVRRYAKEAEARRREAEQAEREQIAAELHDVLSHSLSQISVQSGMGLHLFERDPERAREALRNIRGLAGSGLEEARGVLAALRRERAPLTPLPQLADLPALLQQHRALGLTVVQREDLGGHPIGGQTQAAAYRIVREALTNVVRHAGADRAEVRLTATDSELLVQVEDDGTGIAEPSSGGGLRSMRDRAELAGGSLAVRGGAGGRGTVICAHLPRTKEHP